MRQLTRSLIGISLLVSGVFCSSGCVQGVAVNSTTNVIYVAKLGKLYACIEGSEGLKCDKSYTLP